MPPAEIPEEALAAARQEAAEFKDRWVRSVAEFENFKKRTYREREEWSVRRTAEVFEDFLRIRDDFERSLAHLPEESQDPLTSGYRLLYRHVVEFCERHGVKQFDARGSVFDPELHDAILQVPRGDVPPGQVVDVALPGYMLGERVLRHAQVVVSTGPEGSPGD
jgi:molecular chaperone GrpE